MVKCPSCGSDMGYCRNGIFKCYNNSCNKLIKLKAVLEERDKAIKKIKDIEEILNISIDDINREREDSKIYNCKEMSKFRSRVVNPVSNGDKIFQKPFILWTPENIFDIQIGDIIEWEKPKENTIWAKVCRITEDTDKYCIQIITDENTAIVKYQIFIKNKDVANSKIKLVLSPNDERLKTRR